MTNTEHASTDRWRVVVARSTDSSVLFVKSGGALALPEVEIPRNQRPAWHLNEQMKRVWHLHVLSIVPLVVAGNGSEARRAPCHLLEFLAADEELAPNLLWVEPSVAMQEFVIEPTVAAALGAAVSLQSADGEQNPPPFARLGWFEEASLWCKSAAAAFGLVWDGAFEQFTATDSFSLIRFATKPQALWFKAVGESFATDFRVSKLLAHRIPSCVPRIVAAREDWRAWLAEECSGTTLDAGWDFGLWQNAASTLARLQIESTAFIPELLQAQAHPLHQTLSNAAVERFHSSAKEILSAQSVQGSIADGDLAEIDCAVRQSLEAVSKSGIPDALGHLDLNSGNVVVSQDRCAYLDWAEATAGFPFLSFDYLLQSFRRVFGAASPQEQDFVEMYLSAWETVAPSHAVRDAWASTPVLAVFAYFLHCIDRCQGELRGVPGRMEYLSSLLRRLKREAAGTRRLDVGAPR